jgi:hypothetical protein
LIASGKCFTNHGSQVFDDVIRSIVAFAFRLNSPDRQGPIAFHPRGAVYSSVDNFIENVNAARQSVEKQDSTK